MRLLVKLFLAISVWQLVSCSIPQDPENSWKKAKEDALKVGVVINDPFIKGGDGNYSGAEVEMVKAFARQNHLKIEWKPGSESELIKLLKEYRLHIVIGDFEKKTLWKKEVGVTNPYDKKHVWLVGRGENRLVTEIDKYFYKPSKL